MRIEPLSSIVSELESGKRPKGGATTASGSIPSLGGEHLNSDGGFDLQNMKYIDEVYFKSMRKGAIKVKGILIVKDGATTGKVSFVDTSFPFREAAINEHLFSLRVNAKLANSKYVFLYLKSPHGQKQILKDFRGAAIGGISRGFTEIATIPLPPLEDQIRIAHLLSKVEGLIAQRKQHLQQLDDLLKSVFLKMFGDPIANERGWEVGTLEDFCVRIVDCPHSTPIYSEGPTGNFCIRSSDIANGFLDFRKTFQVDDAIFTDRIKRHQPQLGDVVYSREGGRLGNAARIIGTEKICLGQRMMLFSTNDQNQCEFLWALLESESFKAKLQGLVGGGAAPRVNIKDLTKILVTKPPMVLQKRFAEIARKMDRSRRTYQLFVAEFELLFAMLSQQAFKGELDLTRVILPDGPKTLDLEETPDPIFERTKHASFELPTPPMPPLKDAYRARELALNVWLAAYTNHNRDQPFSADDFLNLVQQKLSAMEEHIDAEWVSELVGANDYEQVKAWVFQNLKGKKLRQKFDDKKNRVRVANTKE